MAEIKNNLAPRQPSLAYRLRTEKDAPPVVDWLGESPLLADQLLAAAGLKPALPRPRDRARDFLQALLADGPRSTLDIWQAAQEQGLAKRTLYRMRRVLKLRVKTATVNGRLLTFWLLKGQELPAEAISTDIDVPSLEPWLAPLREKYPGNPLADED
jgi:hypothetical protein